ncbi:MAG: VTT domain-containing protein [Gemmatimonadales bacterium]
MLTFLLLTLWCHGPLSPILPAAYEPILLLYGQLYPPLVVAVAGAAASATAECLNYYLYRAMLAGAHIDRVVSSRTGRAVTRMFARRPFLTVWICAWSPLPDWAARVLAVRVGYSIRRYLTAVLAGRIPQFWFLAAIGMHWAPSGWTVATIVVVSAAATLAGMFFRNPRRQHLRVAGRATLLIVGAAVTPPALGVLPHATETGQR